VPPTSRRSARQQRIAAREANRNLARAGTRGSSGGSNRSFLIYTLGAIVVAAVVIGGALFLTQPKAVSSLTSPYPPQASAVTPTSIPVDGRTLGQSTATHTLDIWEDFQCPNCQIFTLSVEPQVVANYVQSGKVKLVYHDFLVIDSKYPGATESLDAANAALCAADQNQFWPYHDWLFTNQYSENSGAFTKDRLKTIGQEVGIKDLSKFNSCVDSGQHNSEIQTVQGQIPTTWTGTPTLIIDNGTPLASYDYATVSAALDQALGVVASPSPGASGSAAPSSSASAAPSASPS
jgi:protein-disulfide isomerase